MEIANPIYDVVFKYLMEDNRVAKKIFDQENRQENHHIMNVQEIDFPEKFRPIIRRLQAAAQEKEVRDTMTIEDDFIAELNDYEHRIAEAVRKQEEAQRQQAEERSLREEAIRKQEEAVKLLLRLGIPAAEVAEKLGLNLEYIEKLGAE